MTDFLCGLWCPACISRRVVAIALCLQVKGVLIQVYRDCFLLRRKLYSFCYSEGRLLHRSKVCIMFTIVQCLQIFNKSVFCAGRWGNRGFARKTSNVVPCSLQLLAVQVTMPVERMRMRPWLEEQINSNTIPGLKWINKVRCVRTCTRVHVCVCVKEVLNSSVRGLHK